MNTEQKSDASANQGPADVGEHKTARRGLLAVLGGVFAVASLRAAPAQATTNTSVVGASTSSVGLLATTGTSGSPILPDIGSTTHSIIGSNSSLTVLPIDSGVAGARSGSERAGVLGANGGAGYGVYGVTQTGTGSFGISTSGVGMRGVSTEGIGVSGISTNSFGAVFTNQAPNRPALLADNKAATNKIAGLFKGDVRIQGNFSVTGNKAAAVTMPDGTEATMYCQESPEPYFEDFGRARLVNGVAKISMEREFASLIHRDAYMVFLTPEGDCNGLFVDKRDDQSFEVRELKGGTSSIAFSYRLVAKRNDIVGERLVRLAPLAEDTVELAFDHPSTKPRRTATAARYGSDDV